MKNANFAEEVPEFGRKTRTELIDAFYSTRRQNVFYKAKGWSTINGYATMATKGHFQLFLIGEL